MPKKDSSLKKIFERVQTGFATPFLLTLSFTLLILSLSHLSTAWLISKETLLFLSLVIGYLGLLNWTATTSFVTVKVLLSTLAPYLILVGIFASLITHITFLKTVELEKILNYIQPIAFLIGLLGIIADPKKLNGQAKDVEMGISQTGNKTDDFKKKFPRLHRIPVLGRISLWFYKEGLVYSLLILIIVGIFTFLLNYKLTSFNYYEDETLLVSAAVNYNATGTLYKWDWLRNQSGEFTECITTDEYCHYTRAWPDTLVIAGSFKIFGVSEWASRIASVAFGFITILIFYKIARYFTQDKKTALLAIVILSFNPEILQLFRYTRMYALLLPVFLATSYFIFRALTENKSINIRFAALACVFLSFGYFVHINSLIILPAALCFLVYLALKYRQKQYIGLVAVSLLLLSFVVVLGKIGSLGSIFEFIAPFKQSNYEYFNFLFKYPLTTISGGFLVLVALIKSLVSHNGKRDRLIYLFLVVISAVTFFTWIANRYAGFDYISHIVPISALLIAVGLTSVSQIRTKLGSIFQVIIILGVLGTFVAGIPQIYNLDGKYGQYSEAYPTISENFKVDTDVLFGQYLASFYLQELPDDAKFISMLNNQQYSFGEFIRDISNSKSGWITWESRKSFHIQKSIRDYIAQNFTKYHGIGVDNTNVEVYRFDTEDSQTARLLLTLQQ